MFSNENTYEQIDRYLLNEMTAIEKKTFEEKIAKNDELAEEIEQQKIMIQAMDEHDEALQKTVIENPTDSDINFQRKKLRKYRSTRKNRILSTLGIAVSISIITFISTLYIMNRKAIKIKQEKSSAFTQLEKRIIALEEKISQTEKQLLIKPALFSQDTIQVNDTLFILYKK